MKIWIYLNGIQQGPYTLDQLRMLPLTPDTPVWYEGLPEWTPASKAPETAAWFSGDEASDRTESYTSDAGYARPMGAAPNTAAAVQPEPRPATYMVWCILLTVLCCSPFALAGIITGAMTTSRYNMGRYEAARKMSEWTEWLLILAIVFSIIGLPFSLAMSAL